jgi:hypothetical protein
MQIITGKMKLLRNWGMKAAEGWYMNQQLLTVQNNHPLHYGACARYKCSSSQCIWDSYFSLSSNAYETDVGLIPRATLLLVTLPIFSPHVSIYQNRTVHTQNFHYMTLQDASICAKKCRSAHSYKYVRSIIIWYLIPRWCHCNFPLTYVLLATLWPWGRLNL